VTLPAPGDLFEAAIIGAGPAGAAAAVQLKRYGIEPLVFEKDRVGGLLRNANLVENYPGFPEGISGLDLVDRINFQLQRVGVEVIHQKVTGVDYQSGAFCLVTPARDWYARRLVLATGTEPCPIDVTLSTGAAGRVFSEVYPLLQKRGLRVLVMGGGDAAFDYALNLADKDGRVTILNRGETVKCLPLLWKRAEDCPAVRYLSQTEILSIEEDEQGKDLTALCRTPHGEISLTADYVLFATGRKPALDLISKRLQEQSQELIGAGRLYFVGDVQNGIFRQTAIAAGDGIRAAMQICRAFERQPLEVSLISRRH
jgi:thioredoxin reductase (NADPH)